MYGQKEFSPLGLWQHYSSAARDAKVKKLLASSFLGISQDTPQL